jgi:hypothetical protein
MADVASPNALYPAPPQQAPASTNLLANPAQAVGIMNGLQDFRLKQQQFDALSQQPAASLQGQNISNATAEMQQQEMASRAVSRIMGGYLAGIPKPSSDDVRSAAAFAARSLPNVAVKYPDIISAASETGRKNPGLLINSGLSPEGQSGEVPGGPGPGNAPTIIKTPASNMGIGRVTGAAPGIVEAQTHTAQRSSDAYSSASEAAGAYGQRINPLRQAIPILEGMKETDIGPISEKWNDIKSTAVNLGAGPLLGIDPEKIKDVNELKKYFNQYSVQAGATLGPHTNDGLAAAVTSNPNIHMDRLSALDLSKVALGVERMRQAAVLEFNAKVDRGQADPSQFNKFMTDWGTKQDPRAFVYDLMTKEQQEKIKKGLPPEELKKIRNGMNIADRHGLLGDVHQ